MQIRFNRAMTVVGLSLAGLTLIGCKESQPSDYQQNMAVDGEPLLAVGNARTVTAVSSGQAEWVEFRDPKETAGEPEPVVNDISADTGDIEQEIRDFIADYNEVLIDRDIDATLDFFVDSQKEVLKPIILAMFDVADRFNKLRETISAQLPSAAVQIDGAFYELGPVAQAELEVTSIEAATDGQATGTLPPGSLTESCRFVLVDEDWYLEYAPDQLTAQSAAILADLEKLLTSIEGTKLSADELLAKIEGAAATEDEATEDESGAN